LILRRAGASIAFSYIPTLNPGNPRRPYGSAAIPSGPSKEGDPMKTALGWSALLAGLVLASPGLGNPLPSRNDLRDMVHKQPGVMPITLAPAAKATWTLTFRNELRGAVIVQTVTSVGGRTRRDKPVLLASGATVTLPFDGHKIYTIYDARSNR